MSSLYFTLCATCCYTIQMEGAVFPVKKSPEKSPLTCSSKPKGELFVFRSIFYCNMHDWGVMKCVRKIPWKWQTYCSTQRWEGSALTQAVWRFVVAVSLSVEAVPGVTCTDNTSKVISALLLAGRRCTHIHVYRERGREHTGEHVKVIQDHCLKTNITVITQECY